MYLFIELKGVVRGGGTRNQWRQPGAPSVLHAVLGNCQQPLKESKKGLERSRRGLGGPRKRGWAMQRLKHQALLLVCRGCKLPSCQVLFVCHRNR